MFNDLSIYIPFKLTKRSLVHAQITSTCKLTSETGRAESAAARLSPCPSLALQMRSLRSGEATCSGEGGKVSRWHHGVQETAVVGWE